MKKRTAPHVLVLCQNEEVEQILKHRLLKLGCHYQSEADENKFLLRLKAQTPDLCMFYCESHGSDEDQDLIQMMRSILGKELPILLFTTQTGKDCLAKAVRSGASDVLLWPTPRFLFNEKVASLTSMPQHHYSESILKNLPEGQKEGRLMFHGKIKEITESSIKIIGSNLISKGAVIYIKNPLIEVITGSRDPLLVTVFSNYVDAETGLFGVECSYPQDNPGLVRQFRHRISSRQDSRDGVKSNQDGVEKKVAS